MTAQGVATSQLVAQKKFRGEKKIHFNHESEILRFDTARGQRAVFDK
jgi:hypothetical protein